MFKLILKDSPESFDEIDFTLIKNGRTEEENIKAFNSICASMTFIRLNQ